MLCYAILYYIILDHTVLYSTLLCYNIPYYTLLYKIYNTLIHYILHYTINRGDEGAEAW